MAISAGKQVLRLPLTGLKHWMLRRELEPERSRPKEQAKFHPSARLTPAYRFSPHSWSLFFFTS